MKLAVKHFRLQKIPTPAAADFFIGKNVKLREPPRPLPLSGIHAAVVTTPNSSNVFYKLLKSYGADVKVLVATEREDTSTPPPSANLGWSSAMFVKEYVSSMLPSQEMPIRTKTESTATIQDPVPHRVVNMANTGDVNLVKTVANKVDVMVDESGKWSQAAMDPRIMLISNPYLIFLQLTGLPETEIITQGDRLRIWNIAVRMHVFSSLALALYDREFTRKGQVITLDAKNIRAVLKDLDETLTN